jgi:GNAT superfamily N-acetyltransferase
MENQDAPRSPADTIQIRPARPGDEFELFELVRQLSRFEHLEHQLTGSASDLALGLFTHPPVANALVADRSGRLIGYAIYFSTFSTFLMRPGIWLEDLFVSESERDKGVGKRLLSGVAEVARKRCAGRLEWAVLDWNTRAIDFYRSLGAELLPDWRICRVEGAGLERL